MLYVVLIPHAALLKIMENVTDRYQKIVRSRCVSEGASVSVSVSESVRVSE